METVFLWVSLCFNAACTDSQLYQYEAYSAVERELCKTDLKEMNRVLSQANKTFRTACKTQAQFDKEGL